MRRVIAINRLAPSAARHLISHRRKRANHAGDQQPHGPADQSNHDQRNSNDQHQPREHPENTPRRLDRISHLLLTISPRPKVSIPRTRTTQTITQLSQSQAANERDRAHGVADKRSAIPAA
jgi:hypothetical protein